MKQLITFSFFISYAQKDITEVINTPNNQEYGLAFITKDLACFTRSNGTIINAYQTC